jgi:hypothetical protein
VKLLDVAIKKSKKTPARNYNKLKAHFLKHFIMTSKIHILKEKLLFHQAGKCF